MSGIAMRLVSVCVLVIGVATPGSAQTTPRSLDDVARLVSGRTRSTQILDLLKSNCISFLVNEDARTRLRGAGADSVLLRGLDGVCYTGSSLEVTSEPMGAEIWIGQQLVGKSPWTSPYPVTTGLMIEARLGAISRTAVADVAPRTLLRVHFSIPRDTLRWPTGRSVLEFGRALGLADQFQSRLPKPTLPPEPKGWGKFKFLLAGAVLGGAAAYAAGSTGCAVTSESRVVEGRTYGGTNLGTSGSCSMGYAAAGGATGALLSLGMGKVRFNGRVRRFTEAKQGYDKSLVRWEGAKANEQEAWLRGQPRIAAALDSQTKTLAPLVDGVRRENAVIAGRNAALPRAAVVERLAASPIFPPGERLVAGPAVDVDTNIPRTRTQNRRAVAVVIGNRQYQTRDVPPVEYAQRDAEVVRQYLIDALGFRDENIIFAIDASAARLQSIFGTATDAQGVLANYVAVPDSTNVFVYYSGHGAPDNAGKTAYLVPSDVDPNFVSLAGYPLSRLYENLTKLKARSLTVVLDACFSGQADKGTLLRGARSLTLEVETPLLADANAVLLAAGLASQIASSYDEKRHGLFTYFFLKAAQGAADANGDRQITFAEVGSYVGENVMLTARRLTGRQQTPHVVGRTPERVLLTLESR